MLQKISCCPALLAERKSTPFRAALVATATYPGCMKCCIEMRNVTIHSEMRIVGLGDLQYQSLRAANIV